MGRRAQPPQEQISETGESSRGRSKRRGRVLKVLVLGGVVAFAAKPAVRSRVLDLLFGPEEQFEYESPTEPVAPDLQSERTQAPWPGETGTAWPPPASEPQALVGEADEDEPGAWRFSQHDEWTAESSVAFGAAEAAEESGEYSEVDEDFGREIDVGGDSAAQAHDQAGPPAEAPSPDEPAGFGVAEPPPEAAASSAWPPAAQSAPEAAASSAWPPAAQSAPEAAASSAWPPAAQSAPEAAASSAWPPAAQSAPEAAASSAWPPAAQSAPEAAASSAWPPAAQSAPEAAASSAWPPPAPEPAAHADWPPPAAGDPHDSAAAPSAEQAPPVEEPDAPATPPLEDDGPAIGEATPRSEADAPRGGWWLSRLRKDADAAPEPPRWD